MTTLPEKFTKNVRAAAKLARSTFKVGSKVAEGRWVESRLPGDFAPRSTDRFTVCAYFASDMSSVYQLEQWLWSFERCAEGLRTSGYGEEPFAIIVRDAVVARHLRSKTRIPVRFSRLTKGLDAFMTSPSLRAVFYVNQATGNFQALRFPRPAHVHLSHGESEKISMISNQLKAYDYVFTAGPAARERIQRALIGMPEDHMIDVGRPPLDRPRTLPQEWVDFAEAAPQGPAVFWAPTWEGDSPSMAYGTLPETGTAIAEALLGSGCRVIFRPHPRTGVLDPRFARALRDVERIVDEHPGGFVDRTPSVGWQFDVADVAVAEMSSVAFDWLSTGKPLVMVEPSDPRADVLPGGLFDRVPTIRRGNVSAIAATVLGAQADQATSAHYLGASEPGLQIRRFIDATRQVVTGRTEVLSARR